MQTPRRNHCLVLLLFIFQLIFLGHLFAEEPVLWRQVAENLQQRMEKGIEGDDISISFQNSPYKKYMEDELMAYTFRSDGMVVIQMHDQVKQFSVSSSEFLWLAKFLVEHKLSSLPEKEAEIPDSASFAVNIKVGNFRKVVWLYNKGNDKNREVIWQYLLHLGQFFLQDAGLRDKDLAIFPACLGVNRIEELDNNNDGVIEWFRLRIGFHAFKAGEFTFDFSGVRHTVFLAQGNTEKEFFLNTYLLQPDCGFKKESLIFAINSCPPYPTGAYNLDLGLEQEGSRRKNLRAKPDFVFEGAESGKFPMHLRQSAIVEVKNNQFKFGDKLLCFTLSEITPEGVRLTGKDKSVSLACEEKMPIGDFGCISGLFGLAEADHTGATFEIDWNIPDADAVKKKVEYFQEVLINDEYPGDKETVKSSLDSSQECLGQLDGIEEFKINVIYSTPAEVI